MSRNAARIAFLDLIIPDLWHAGLHIVAARYSVERDRLIALAADPNA